MPLLDLNSNMKNARRNSSNSSSTVRFPDLPSHRYSEDAIEGDGEHTNGSGTFSRPAALPNGTNKEGHWHPRIKDRNHWSSKTPVENGRRRQKSLSEAWQSIRFRRGSVTDSAKEITEALKAPVSPRLVVLCGLWYMTSVFSNASSKSILIAFRYPVTLTVVQFAFVSFWCIVCSIIAQRFPAIKHAIPALRYPIRAPSRDLIITTLPLTAFQIGGHILNSDAMSRIPVSLVHTIKGLSPLLTVMAYRLFLRVKYSTPTYLSLIPLTLGVILACSANISGDFVGLVNAFGSTVLFVTQNMVSKKLFNEAARAESENLPASVPQKPDKLNLLCYSSGLALLLTLPLWVYAEGTGLITDIIYRGTVPLSERPDALDHGRLTLEFIFNGTFHFTQSLVAFVLLSMISPVTYSVASLIKRVFVICFAIVWFGNPVTRVQGFGIALTFLGLYLYDRTNDAARADRRARALQANAESILPIVREKDTKRDDNLNYNQSAYSQSPIDMYMSSGSHFLAQKRPTTLAVIHTSGQSSGRTSPSPPLLNEGFRKNAGNSEAPSRSHSPWRPGTRQEDTRTAKDGNGISA